MDLTNLIKNPMKFIKDINKLKDIVNILDNENLLIETSMESSKLKILNESIPNLKFEPDKHVNELEIMLNLTGNNKTKRDVESLIGKFIFVLTKHLWCLYLTDKITYDKLNAFYLNLYGTNIDEIQNEENILNSSSVSPGLTSSSGPIGLVSSKHSIGLPSFKHSMGVTGSLVSSGAHKPILTALLGKPRLSTSSISATPPIVSVVPVVSPVVTIKELQRLVDVATQEVTDATEAVRDSVKTLKKAVNKKVITDTALKLANDNFTKESTAKPANLLRISKAMDAVTLAEKKDTDADIEVENQTKARVSAETRLTNATTTLTNAETTLANATTALASSTPLIGGSNDSFVQKELDVNTNMFFKSKYLKYKQKYIALKKLN